MACGVTCGGWSPLPCASGRGGGGGGGGWAWRAGGGGVPAGGGPRGGGVGCWAGGMGRGQGGMEGLQTLEVQEDPGRDEAALEEVDPQGRTRRTREVAEEKTLAGKENQVCFNTPTRLNVTSGL